MVSKRAYIWALMTGLSVQGALADVISPATISAPTISPPTISIVGLHSPGFTAEGPQLTCRVRVDNPHHDSFQVNDANVRLHLADAHVANGRLGEPIVVAANDSTEIDVLVEMVPGAAFSWIPLFMGGPDFKVPFEVAGTIYVDEASIGNLPFRQKGIVEKTPQGIQIYPGS